MFLGAPRLKTVFASRWRALWFAGVVLLTAYCSVPDPEPADGAPETANTTASATPSAKPGKWWAPDKAAPDAQ